MGVNSEALIFIVSFVFAIIGREFIEELHSSVLEVC